MWLTGQTLLDTKTGKLVRYDGYYEKQKDGGKIEHFMLFTYEHGKQHETKNSRRYTHIENWLGHPVIGRPEKGQIVDHSLSQYVVSESTRRRRREALLIEWEKNVLDKMDKDETIQYLFCSVSDEIRRKYFFDKHEAIKLFDNKSWSTPYYGHHLLKYQGKVWIYDGDHLYPLPSKEFEKMKGLFTK